MLMFYRAIWTGLGLIFLLNPKANCLEYDLLKVIQKKQFVISGLLNPGSISFNGQEIFNGKENFEALLVNKKPVDIKIVAGLKTFYFLTEESSINLEWQQSDGQIRQVLAVEYPALLEFKTDASLLKFKFNSQVSEARLDSVKINLSEPTYEVENFKQWVQQVHTLELDSNKNTSQIYNLNLASIKKDLLTTKSISYYIGDAPFSANKKPTAFGLSKRVMDENNISIDYGIYYSTVSFDMGFGNLTNGITQSTSQFKARYGYNPYDVNFGGFSFRRLTFGVQAEIINYKRTSDFATNIEGINTTNVDFWYAQAGPFFRWEPYQYNRWGVFINFDLQILRTQQNLSSDGEAKYFGLSYYY